MNRRIIGIETEYGITCASTQGTEPPMGADEASQRLFKNVLSSVKATNAYLPNGARLYLDVGSHPEYASAECSDIDDIIANTRAGERILARMAQSTNEQLADERIPGQIHVFNNNLDSAGNSFGCHENYLIRRHRDFRSKMTSLIPFFVTRQILVGAGFIHRSAGRTVHSESDVNNSARWNGDADSELFHGSARFEISPRAWKMLDPVSSATTNARPMINTRDEPHGDPERFRRMHVIVGDTNVSQSTVALKVGMTNAVLNVLEQYADEFPDYALVDPMRAIRCVSADLSGQALLETVDGQTVTALEIQRSIHDCVVKVYERNGWIGELSAVETYVFNLWERALEAFERGQRENLAREIDWIAKERLLRAYQARSGASWGDPRLARLELAWHDITSAGLRPKLEATGALHVVIPDTAVTNALTTPPHNTRAKLRGEFIAAAQTAQKDYMVDWTNVRLLTNTGSRNVVLNDPFATVDAEVEELMEAVKRP